MTILQRAEIQEVRTSIKRAGKRICVAYIRVLLTQTGTLTPQQQKQQKTFSRAIG